MIPRGMNGKWTEISPGVFKLRLSRWYEIEEGKFSRFLVPLIKRTTKFYREEESIKRAYKFDWYLKQQRAWWMDCEHSGEAQIRLSWSGREPLVTKRRRAKLRQRGIRIWTGVI